jgi:predicted permease
LSLGLGANTAIFSLADMVMWKQLPVKAPERLFFVDNSGGKSGGSSGPPYPCYEILRDRNHFFAGMAAFNGQRFKVTIDGRQQQLTGQYASGTFFDVSGVGAALGRLTTDADDSIVGRGGPDGGVAVISYRFWESRFDRSPSVLGKVIQVGANWVTIVGVTQEGFNGLQVGERIDVTIPMALSSNNLRSKQYWWFSVVGRLKDGVSAAQAQAELDGYFQNYMQENGVRGGTRAHFNRIALVPAARGLEELRRQFSQPVLIVMTIVGVVLLIGCANAANLLLARASARRDEIALRLAIGASRWRLARQLFTEGLLLVAAAAVLGVAFAKWGVGLLVALFAGGRAHMVLEPRFDVRVLAFTAAVALLTGLLFSFAPVLHAARTDAAKPGSGGRSGMSVANFRAGNVLVVIQIMLSLVLLCGAALFLRSLGNLSGLDAGFEREGVVTMRVDGTFPRGPAKKGAEAEEEHARLGRVWVDVLARLQNLPLVSSVSASSLSPMSGRDRGILMEVVGFAPPPESQRGIHINQVSAGYFETFGLRAVMGRVFAPGDRGNSAKVAILNESAARKFLPDGRPLGRMAMFPGQTVPGPYQIVGVVRDARYENLRKEPEPMVYVPIEQSIDPMRGVNLAIRTTAPANAVLPAVRQHVRAFVPEGFITEVGTLREQVGRSLVGERMLSVLASLFGGLALVLSAIGLYGIMSFTVIRRTRELGIRIAVGARRGSVIWLVLRSTLGQAAAGLILGLPLVWLATDYLQSQLYGVRAADPIAVGGAVTLLLTVAVASALLPAWRASRVDPMTSLRTE